MYAIGDFIMIEDGDVGVIAIKQKKEKHIRQMYWFADEYNYLVSLPEYNGDYQWVSREEIVKKLELPIEYKISMISKFGDWWRVQHKQLYQQLIIELLN